MMMRMMMMMMVMVRMVRMAMMMVIPRVEGDRVLGLRSTLGSYPPTPGPLSGKSCNQGTKILSFPGNASISNFPNPANIDIIINTCEVET